MKLERRATTGLIAALTALLASCSSGPAAAPQNQATPSVASDAVAADTVAAVTTPSGYTFDLQFEILQTSTSVSSVSDAPPGMAEVSKPQFEVKSQLTNTTEERNLPAGEAPRFVVKALWKAKSKMCTTAGALGGIGDTFKHYAQLEKDGCGSYVVEFGWPGGTVSPGATTAATSEASVYWDGPWEVPEDSAVDVVKAAARPDGFLIEVYLADFGSSPYQDIKSPTVLRCETAAPYVPDPPVIWASAKVACIPDPE